MQGICENSGVYVGERFAAPAEKRSILETRIYKKKQKKAEATK